MTSQLTPPISQQAIRLQVESALAEDLGGHIDVNADITANLIGADANMQAKIVTREDCVLCGRDWAQAVFDIVGQVALTWHFKDGDQVKAGDTLVTLNGNARSILTAERSALNYLQSLSGTATTTAHYVAYLSGSNTRLLDTRKTIPGLRLAQKYAVTCGGGLNHRIGLFDAFLIKENHIAACGGIAQAVAQAKKQAPERPIEVEVESLDELKQAIKAGVNTIMLDNFSTKLVQEAVVINAGQCKLEVSGNITFERLQELAETGVDYVSSGALTKNLNSIDLSLISA